MAFVRCDGKSGMMGGRCQLDSLHPGDHDNGAKTWPRSRVEEDLLVATLRAMDRRNNAAADRQELLRRNERNHQPSPTQEPAPNENAAPNVLPPRPRALGAGPVSALRAALLRRETMDPTCFHFRGRRCSLHRLVRGSSPNVTRGSDKAPRCPSGWRGRCSDVHQTLGCCGCSMSMKARKSAVAELDQSFVRRSLRLGDELGVRTLPFASPRTIMRVQPDERLP